MEEALLLIRWPSLGLAVRARPCLRENPSLCRQIAAALPLESCMGHVVISGETVWLPTPILHFGRENMVTRQTGDVYFFGSGQSVCLTYGAVTETARVNKFAETLPEDLPVLRQAGRRILEETVYSARRSQVPVQVRWAGPPPGPAPEEARPQGAAYETAAQFLLRARAIWAKEPEEITLLRSGVPLFPGGEEMLSRLVLAESETLLLGQRMLYAWLLMARKEAIPLEDVRQLAQAVLAGEDSPLASLERLGLGSIARMGRRYLTALEALGNKEEFIALTGAFCTYCNRMHRWVHAVFPWNLGLGAFPQRRPDQLAAVAALARRLDGTGA